MSLKKCIGIISFMPGDPGVRSRRKDCLRKLLAQIGEYLPNIDVLIIAQNWQDDVEQELPEISNKLQVVKFENKLGILNARKKLREEYLKLDYDYIIMMDDDCVIAAAEPADFTSYLETIDAHPNGFAFIKGIEHWETWHHYAHAPLNLCAISTAIYSAEPLLDFDPENKEALEDEAYAILLHAKYAEVEFELPAKITFTHYQRRQYIRQFSRPMDVPPSTWYNAPEVYIKYLYHNTRVIYNYANEHHTIDANAVKGLPEWRQ